MSSPDLELDAILTEYSKYCMDVERMETVLHGMSRTDTRDAITRLINQIAKDEIETYRKLRLAAQVHSGILDRYETERIAALNKLVGDQK